MKAWSGKSYNDMWPTQTQQISMQDTLKVIYDGEEVKLRQHYVGPNMKILNDTHVTFKCSHLFQSVINLDGGRIIPCKTIMTDEVHRAFTLDGKIHWQGGCKDDTGVDKQKEQNGGNNTWVWTVNDIEEASKRFDMCAYYGNTACIETAEKYGELYIKDKVGMVLGTQLPWAEGGLINYGAKAIITVEYNKIISHHSKVTAIHPVDLAKQFLQNSTIPQVDFIFSYSSLEHDGLGRYGDPICPYADIESIARAHCLLKPGGIFFLGVPMGYDIVDFNSHRIYGKYRWRLILPFWDAIDLIGNWIDITNVTFRGLYQNQAIWVLRKKEVGHHD